MEVIATHDETDGLLQLHPTDDFLVFPEDRHLSIRMWNDLPYRWIVKGANKPFEGTAKRAEYFTFQLGLWAPRHDLKSVNVRFSQLKSYSVVIPKEAFTCFNTSGVDYQGNPFSIDLNVAKGRVQPLWCGIDIPKEAKPGSYTGYAIVSAEGAQEVRIPITLTVENTIAKDHGDDRPEDMTRLRWLNSKLGEDHEIVKPYSESGPIGCATTLADSGLFQQVSRTISSRVDRFARSKVILFASPMPGHRE
jgi:hypothetical protein